MCTSGYNKIHTYDAFNYRESDTVKPGNELVTFELDGVTVGVAICYDVRFPEQFKALARQGAEVIVVPTSWADGPENVISGACSPQRVRWIPRLMSFALAATYPAAMPRLVRHPAPLVSATL